MVLNNKSAKLLYISNKKNQNYRKQSNLTTILTNNEAKRDKRAQLFLKYSVNEPLSLFENHPFLREAAFYDLMQRQLLKRSQNRIAEGSINKSEASFVSTES